MGPDNAAQGPELTKESPDHTMHALYIETDFSGPSSPQNMNKA